MMAYSNSSTQRIFPPIQPDLYTTSENWTPLTPDQRVAQTILTLANQEFSRWEWLAGWKLDSLGQIGRLLRQHKLAMEAELAAQWQKADFFWTQVQIEVKRLSRRHNVWQALASAMSGDEPGVVVMGDRFRLRQRLVDELFIDTHFAFYNGLAGRGEKLSLKDRAFVHTDYILKLFDLSDLPESRLLSLLDQPWQQQLSLCQEVEKWQQARKICSKRLKYFPRVVHYQNAFAEVFFLESLAKLKINKYSANMQLRFNLDFKTIFMNQGEYLKEEEKKSFSFVNWLFLLVFSVFLNEMLLNGGEIISSILPALMIFIVPVLIIFTVFIFVLFLGLIFKEITGSKSDIFIRSIFPDVVKTDHTGFVNINRSLAQRLSKSTIEVRELKDAKKIQKSINGLKKYSKDYPYNLRIFKLLAKLHHLQSIKLVNGGYIAESIFLVQKSLTYNPYLKETLETQNKLTAIMNELQFQARAFETKIARQPSVNLTHKQKHLKAQATKGFTLANTYLKSREAQAIADAFKVVQAGSVWQSIGLTESAKDWSQQALLLSEQLNLILNNPPQDQAGIADIWKAVTITHPTLGELDPVKIHAFLERKLFGTGNEPIVTLPTPPHSPRITPVSSKRKPGTEPFLPWLFSRQNVRLKIQAIIASILVLTAGTLTIQDLSIRSTRNLAYQQTQDAELQQDILGVVEGAEKFLDKTPLSGEDERDQQVKEIYSSALVRWLARQNNPLDEKAQVHLERYQALNKEN